MNNLFRFSYLFLGLAFIVSNYCLTAEEREFLTEDKVLPEDVPSLETPAPIKVVPKSTIVLPSENVQLPADKKEDKIDLELKKKVEDLKETKPAEVEDNKDEDLILKSSGEWKGKEAGIFRMPSSATKGIKGQSVPYMIWFDDSKWKEADQLNLNAEKSLKSENDDVLAIITTEKKQYALEQLDDIVIKNAKASGFDKASIVGEEKRIVNGNEVLFIHWKASIKGQALDFLSYIYSGKEGTVMMHTYTSSNLLEKNRKSMENLLNGLSVENLK